VRSIRDLLIVHNERCAAAGFRRRPRTAAPRWMRCCRKATRWGYSRADNLSAEERWFSKPPHGEAAFTLARKALRALGLRAAAVDLFTDIGGEQDAMRVIEVNSNPSIRLLRTIRPRRSDPENLASYFFGDGPPGCLNFRNTAMAFAWPGWRTCSTPIAVDRARLCSVFRWW